MTKNESLVLECEKFLVTSLESLGSEQWRIKATADTINISTMIHLHDDELSGEFVALADLIKRTTFELLFPSHKNLVFSKFTRTLKQSKNKEPIESFQVTAISTEGVGITLKSGAVVTHSVLGLPERLEELDYLCRQVVATYSHQDDGQLVIFGDDDLDENDQDESGDDE